MTCRPCGFCQGGPPRCRPHLSCLHPDWPSCSPGPGPAVHTPWPSRIESTVVFLILPASRPSRTNASFLAVKPRTAPSRTRPARRLVGGQAAGLAPNVDQYHFSIPPFPVPLLVSHSHPARLSSSLATSLAAAVSWREQPQHTRPAWRAAGGRREILFSWRRGGWST